MAPGLTTWIIISLGGCGGLPGPAGRAGEDGRRGRGRVTAHVWETANSHSHAGTGVD